MSLLSYFRVSCVMAWMQPGDGTGGRSQGFYATNMVTLEEVVGGGCNNVPINRGSVVESGEL